MRLSPTQWPRVGLRAAKWLTKKIEQNFTFCFSVSQLSLTSKQITDVSLAVFQGRYPRAIIMHPIRQFQWTDTKATSENLIIFFLENNKVQQGLTKKIILFLSTIFTWWYKKFQSSYITFDIFDNSTYFGTTEKTKEKWL